MILSDMRCGQSATITGFGAQISEETKQRLEELGLYKDRSIRLLRLMPFGGPLSIVVGGLVLALDKHLAQEILVISPSA